MDEAILTIAGTVLIIWAILGQNLRIEVRLAREAPLDFWKRLILAALGLTLVVVSVLSILGVRTPRVQVLPIKAVQGSPRATFLGQDGESYAGRQCASGARKDNIHIRLDGLRTDVRPVSYRVEDRDPGGVWGVWATPCDPVSNWLLFVTSSSPGQADLYFKPFRDAPVGAEYAIIVQYENGTTQTTDVVGSRVVP